MYILKKWPNGGSSQSIALLNRRAMTLKLTGTGGQADRQTDRQTGGQDHVLSQADALTKKLQDPLQFSNLVTLKRTKVSSAAI